MVVVFVVEGVKILFDKRIIPTRLLLDGFIDCITVGVIIFRSVLSNTENFQWLRHAGVVFFCGMEWWQPHRS